MAKLSHFKRVSNVRPSCKDCVRKHLGQACVLMQEFYTGYAWHRWLVIGHLAEAEHEAMHEWPLIANKIREHRVTFIDDDSHEIPFRELIEAFDAD